MWRMSREEWSQGMCDTIGGALIEGFTMHESLGWNEFIPWVYKMEQPCRCTHHFVYDLAMGHDMEWMGMYECVNSWMGAFDDTPMIDRNFTVPDGAESVVALWLENYDAVMYFMNDPYQSIMNYAMEWKIKPQDIVEGLMNWESLLAVYAAKARALGFPQLSPDLLNGDVNHQELAAVIGDRIKHFFDDPMMKHEETPEETAFAENFFPGQVEMFHAMLREPWGMMDGSTEMNFVMFADAYVEGMNQLVADGENNRRSFIPYDAFGLLV